jgi:hypothetical protein
VLPLDAGRAAAGFGPSFQIREGVPTGHEERTTLRLDAYALVAAACAFSWSFRNRSSPLSVSG